MPSVTLMRGFPPAGLDMKLKAAATAIGDPTADRASAHGFRRGFACDLAMEGESLKDILEAGDWRSAAFRRYLETVENELTSKAVLQVLGDGSDSEPEMQ